MKVLYATVCLIMLCGKVLGATNEEWRKSYLDRIEKTKAEPTRQNVMALADEVATNDRYANRLDQEGILLNENARRAVCQIPGHAQYFADALEEEHSKLKPGDSIGGYTGHVFSCLNDTLVHLPSPETVKVLGHYLSDDRDNPTTPSFIGPTAPYPGTGMVAAAALRKIGLRQLPDVDTDVNLLPFDGSQTEEEYLQVASRALAAAQGKREEALASSRAWFAPIKSGEKAFSFKGQAVEYRFNPDGTWVSTPIANPPDDAPKPPPSRPPAPPPAPVAASDAATDAGGHSPIWPWLLGVALLVLPAAAWFLKARRRP